MRANCARWPTSLPPNPRMRCKTARCAKATGIEPCNKPRPAAARTSRNCAKAYRCAPRTGRSTSAIRTPRSNGSPPCRRAPRGARWRCASNSEPRGWRARPKRGSTPRARWGSTARSRPPPPKNWGADSAPQPHTARLLGKHRAFSPDAAQSLVRSLATELIHGARDSAQLQQIWQGLESAERQMPELAIHAARQLAALGGAASQVRAWLLPVWERMLEQPGALTDQH